MAFNPFTAFQKNRRFWMAAVLLMCMITFVLCTGVGGDLSDRLIRAFTGREGTFLAKFDGGKIYSKELYDLRLQRNLANDFMKQACEVALKNLNFKAKEGKFANDKAREAFLVGMQHCSGLLEKRLRNQRYFGTGVKAEDLLDFKIWLKEADRLGINLTDDVVRAMINSEMFEFLSEFNLANQDQIFYEIRRGRYNYVTASMGRKALNDEFRVRIAQLALLTANNDALRRHSEIDIALKTDPRPEVRMTLSPAMMWDYYQKNRSEFDVALLPIQVEDYLKKVEAPTQTELENFFQKYQSKLFDPTSDTPGFAIPAKAKIAYVAADPTSPYFKKLARVGALLEVTPPLANPVFGALPMAVRYGAGPLAKRAALETIYTNSQSRVDYRTGKWTESNVYLPMAAWLAKRHPDAVAALIGASAPPTLPTAPLAYLAMAQHYHPEEVKAALAFEAKRRSPAYATLIAGGATGNGIPVLAMWDLIGLEIPVLGFPYKFLPLEIVQEELAESYERRLAERWVNAQMLFLQAEIEKIPPQVTNRKAAFERILSKYAEPKDKKGLANKDYLGLERRTTDQFFTRYTVAEAKELEPLRKAFERNWNEINFFEGRDLTPELALKEDQFWRLFFDGSENFSAADATFKARPWPPTIKPKNPAQLARHKDEAERMPWVKPAYSPQMLQHVLRIIEQHDLNKEQPTISLFDKAEKPFLFWNSDIKLGRVPDNLDEVKDQVDKALRLQKAREKFALAQAKQIADALQKTDNYDKVLREEAAKTGHPPIHLRNLAPLYAIENGGLRSYVPFPLPKETFSFPRDDMAASLVSLGDLQKSIEISSSDPQKPEPGVKELNDLNKALFETGKLNGQFVQVLTNKPRNAFYVARVTRAPTALPPDFRSAYRGAFSTGRSLDTLLDHAQEDAGKSFRLAFIEQLRRQYRVQLTDTAKDIADFDSNETS